MKKLVILLSSLFLFKATLATADVATNQQESTLSKIEQKNAALQESITQLKEQIQALEASQNSIKKKLKSSRNKIQQNRGAIKQLDRSKSTTADAHEHSHLLYLNALRNSVSVVTSPYPGEQTAYNASDLMVNIENQNEDLLLLQQRQNIETQSKSLGLPYADRPLIIISGELLPQLIVGRNYKNQPVSQITLNTAEVDIEAIASRWAAGFLQLNYDNSTALATGQNISTVNNSRVYVSTGFVTIGDLNSFPLYVTAGQMYAPYGVYIDGLVTNPLTQLIGRALIRTALVGYSQDGVYAETYAYKGDTYIGNRNSIDEGGLNGGYNGNHGPWTYDFGVGYITNMADAQGAQANAIVVSGEFQGFGQNAASEQIHKKIPGGNIHTEIQYNNWNFAAEYISALTAYNPLDMTYNSRGAKPQASHVELDYNRTLLGKPWTFIMAYDRSWEALAYNIPEQSYFGVINVSVWKDTVESIEFRRDVNYPATASAIGSVANSPTPIAPLGNIRNTVTLQLGLYF